jgi:hypothetical protein
MKVRVVSERGNVIFIAGMCVLGYAFASSWLPTIGTIGEEYRTVGILKFNPNDVTQWLRDILTFGVLPISTGLALLVTPFILREKTSTRRERLFCLFVGGFFAAWGVYSSLTAYASYTKAVSWAVQTNVTNITGSLNIIYIGYECIAVLWLVSGVFLSVASICVKNSEQLDGNKRQEQALRT